VKILYFKFFILDYRALLCIKTHLLLEAGRLAGRATLTYSVLGDG